MTDLTMTMLQQPTIDKKSIVNSRQYRKNLKKMDKLLLTMEHQQRRIINYDKFIPTLGGNKLIIDSIS